MPVFRSLRSGDALLPEWYGGPLVYALSSTLDCLALASAVSLVIRQSTKGRLPPFYVALTAVIITHMLDCIGTVIKVLPQAVDTGTLLAPGVVGYAIAGIVFAWCNNAFFTVLNYLRLKPLVDKTYPKASIAIACAVAASWILCTVNNIMFFVMYSNAANLPYVSPTVPDIIYEYWVIVDCIVNTGISVLFLRVLGKMLNSSDATLRPEAPALIREIRVLLVVECVAFISVNGMLITWPDLDPLQLLPYVVESFRLNLFAQFLTLLLRVLRRPPANGAGQLHPRKDARGAVPPPQPLPVSKRSCEMET